MADVPKKRVRNHKSSGTAWTAAKYREAGYVQLHAWVSAELKTRIDALRTSRGETIVQTIEAAISLLESK